jgi:two-component system, cell cycle sensor histidine kinase and response regulator CckA
VNGPLSGMVKALLKRARAVFTTGSAAQAPAEGRDDERLRSTVGGLAAGVAHDLNNILLVLQGYAEMAVEEADASPGVRALLEEMRSATLRAALLVRDLRVLGDRGTCAPRLIDLSEVVRRCLPALRSACPAGFEIRTALAEGLPQVRADEDLVARVVAALCARARESMPEGGVIQVNTSLCVRAGPVRVSLEVTDTGAPITRDARTRMFEPYAPGPGGTKGQGLGMSVVQAAARRLGGEVSVSSGPGGTAIRIRVPPGNETRTADAPRPEPVRPASAPSPAARPGAHTILVAEDDESLRALAVKVLTREGYTVLAARDGQEAVELFSREAPAIHLALLDDVMPRLGGQAALDRIQALAPKLPVILCSGYNWRLDAQACETPARYQTLQKPWQPRDLLRKVREGLEQDS